MHLRTNWSIYNDVCIVYDLVNDTWNIDIGKYYNYTAKNWNIIYWFSDVNTSIYIDDVGYV